MSFVFLEIRPKFNDSIADSSFTSFTAPDALTDATADIGAMLALMASRRAGEVKGSTLPDPSIPELIPAPMSRESELSSTASGRTCHGILCFSADEDCKE